MRQRDPNHEKRLRELLRLDPKECKRQIAVADYREPGHVASEVLASLIRVRFGATTGVLDAATAALHRRVIQGAEIHVRGTAKGRALERKNSEVVAEAIQYFWDKFLRDSQAVCNAEVRFAVYLKDRLDDFMRHLRTEENTRPSVDGMGATDEDGDKVDFIDIVEDPNSESPEQAVIRGRSSSEIKKALNALPRRERNAYYLRIECDYDWTKVASLLDCSVPTARELMKRSLEKLRGVLR